MVPVRAMVSQPSADSLEEALSRPCYQGPLQYSGAPGEGPKEERPMMFLVDFPMPKHSHRKPLQRRGTSSSVRHKSIAPCLYYEDQNLAPKLDDWAEAYKELCGIIKEKLPDVKHEDLYYGQDQVLSTLS